MADVTMQQRELAARSAVLVARMFMIHGWEWSPPDHIPGAESIAETIEWLISEAATHSTAATGRLRVDATDLGTEVYLNLGGIYEGTVLVDDGLKDRRHGGTAGTEAGA